MQYVQCIHGKPQPYLNVQPRPGFTRFYLFDVLISVHNGCFHYYKSKLISLTKYSRYHNTIKSLNFYVSGNLTPYLTSYIRVHSTPSSLRYAESIWIFALAIAFQGLAMFLGGFISSRLGLGPRWTALLGGWIQRYFSQSDLPSSIKCPLYPVI